jgi:predicted HicB family RNase H-like nuclease
MTMEKFSLKKQEYANRTLRFPVELLEELNRVASKTNMSLNHVVMKCCEYALKNLEIDSQDE